MFFIIIGILLLGVIVTVHEFGHFISARIVGIPVKEFSVGFGPQIVAWKSKKYDTVFKLSCIPLGGYCMYYGETASDPDAMKNGEELLDENDPRLYNNHNVWKRLLTVVSGPLMNFVFAFLVAILMVGIFGSDIAALNIGEITDNSPAQIAGLIPGDTVISIDSLDVNDGTLSGISNTINKLAKKDEALNFEIIRNGEKLNIAVTPKYNEAENRYMIGCSIYPTLSKISVSRIVPEAFKYCKEASVLIASALGKLFSTGEGLDQTAGPVGVVKQISDLTRTGGFSVFLNLAVIISINLGLVNLLPIPALDGARIIFMLIEAIRRKPINQKIEGYIHMAGYVLLFGFLIAITFKDIIGLFR